MTISKAQAINAWESVRAELERDIPVGGAKVALSLAALRKFIDAQSVAVPEGWLDLATRLEQALFIIDESEGIAGWHLNGAISPWDEGELPELREELRAMLAAAPQQEPQKPDWNSITAMVNDYIDDYEWRGDDGDYTPNAEELVLIKDAIFGLLEQLPLAVKPAAPQQDREAQPLIARPLAEWREEDGPVMWWAWCGNEWAGEPAWCGTPLCSDWPGYHTHWTPHPAMPSVADGEVQS